MGSEENAQLARVLNDAFERGDMATLDSLIADDIVWHQIGGPDIVGKEALRRAPQPGAGADYEISGNARDILGNGWWLLDVQAHNSTAPQPGPTLVPGSATGENGQLLALFVPDSQGSGHGDHGHGHKKGHDKKGGH